MRSTRSASGVPSIFRGRSHRRTSSSSSSGIWCHDDLKTLARSEEHTSELQSRQYLVCRLLLEKKKHRHPEINDFLLHMLARRADRLSCLLMEAYHAPVDRRVARRLLDVGRLFAEGGLPVVLLL